MEELYQICNQYFCLLLKNIDKLSMTRQIDIARDKNYLNNSLKQIQLRLSSGKFDLSSLINFCKIGDILNMDILSELLINVKYDDHFMGVWNKDILDYYEKQNKNIIDLIKKVLIINIMFDNLVSLVRREYNKDFFRIKMYQEFFDVIDDEVYNYIKELRFIASKLLNNECFCDNNLDNDKKVIDSLKTRRILKEDLLSNLIDDFKFNELVIKEWQVIREHLIIIKYAIKRLLDCNKNFELELFFNFINDMDLFIEKRINDLSFKKIEKVIVKRFD